MPVLKEQISNILDMGILLTRGNDSENILEILVSQAMDISKCEIAALYMLENASLVHHMTYYKYEKKSAITIPTLSLSDHNIFTDTLHRKISFNHADIPDDKQSDHTFLFLNKFSEKYQIRSFLSIPLLSNQEDAMGVLALINSKDSSGNIVPFDCLSEKIILSLASQASVTIANMIYLKEIKDLFHSFISAMAAAIDQRTPYNGSHTRNVTKNAGSFLDFLNDKYQKKEFGEYFNENRKEQLVMAANLHDIGKMIIPLGIMNKASRLEGSLPAIENRFLLIASYLKIDFLEKRLTKEEYKRKDLFLKNSWQLIKNINSREELPEEYKQQVENIADCCYQGKNGMCISYLTPYEKECLLIKHGTLTDSEREIMKSHVAMTSKILENINFESHYKNVPLWAGAHHELLDGSGYPKGLTKESMPAEIRILAMLDIYDALTAADRPYKKPVSKTQAVATLHDMAKAGKLDKNLVVLFEEFIRNE